MNVSPIKMSLTLENSYKNEGNKSQRYVFFLVPFIFFNFNLEHNWDAYLIETNSEAAPACNFKQVNI